MTRPEPGAAETAIRVAALGWHPVLAPALVLEPRPVPLPAAQALLLTSRAAARALAGRFPDLPVLAVGEATAAEARRAGATRLHAATGDARSLADLATTVLEPREGPLLLVAGRGYALDLAEILRWRGFRVRRRVVYDAHPARHLPEEALLALRAGKIGSALFFSPRSAEVTLSLMRDAGLAAAATTVEALALSARVATTLRGLPWRAVRVASDLNQNALLALLGPAGQTGEPPPS
ncbi:uroporphyrinogen-III synthase [Roseomonas gilardii subsp. gilardii]|uniref:uroporphyrinogen-III synthase n=1 Tax=Roseomonas gilardii TaxID=257708 RepID=UPI001FF89787|nr:uroporphyrinogen-III synthase [Roseomonas gilardii]UPG71069.1 uroporphyrinogen-III synthase [Roseomonas gilardii subsp. gilardii]